MVLPIIPLFLLSLKDHAILPHMKRFYTYFFFLLGFVIIGGAYLLAPSNVFEQKGKDAEDPGLNEEQVRSLVGQMLIVGFRGTSVDENSYIVKAIRDLNLGGVILFDYDVPSKTRGRNIIDPEQTKKLIADIESYSPHPLFIALDAEGGLVNRLKPSYGFSDTPSHETLGGGSAEETREAAGTLGKELSDLGFNLDFAPVVDLNVNPENPVIGNLERSFGRDPDLVTAHARAFILGLHEYGILSSLKHFPGHGSSESDSHLGIVDVTDTYVPEELDPFRNLIREDLADTVMVAHVFDRNIDPEYPASLSEKFIRGILREELGFEGVVISDDMQMGAIRDHYGFGEAVVRAVRAGNDILIISNNGAEYDESAAEHAADAIWEAVQNGEIPLSGIQESVERIGSLRGRI